MGVERAEISTPTVMLKQVNYLGSLGGTNEEAAEVLQMMADGTVSSEVEVVGFGDIDESIKRFRAGRSHIGAPRRCARVTNPSTPGSGLM
jgi:D-arabinose 1-dehydrogenase-like Zn-dependent alcohol dehydrogenase